MPPGLLACVFYRLSMRQGTTQSDGYYGTENPRHRRRYLSSLPGTAWFRNHLVHRYQANEQLRDKIVQGRNQSEGFNSYLKQRVGFECMLPRKGAEHAFFHTTLCLLTLNLLALTRLQNGVTENLTSVAYLT